MTIFVTGATGFLGRHLCRALGPQAIPLARPWSYDSICYDLQRSRPDVVVHLAAHYVAEHRPEDIAPMLHANVELVTVLCEAMRATGITRLVTAGTAWQDFNGRQGVPANLYAATKSAADAIVAYYVDAHDFRVVNLRLLNVYGPDDDRPTLLNTIHDGMVMTAGEQETAFVPVAEVVAAIRDALTLTAAMSPGQAPFAVWGEPQSLRACISAQSPARSVQWGAKPYRSREMMTLPNHLPKLTADQVRA